MESQNSDSLDEEDEGSVNDNEFEDDDSNLDDAMFGRRMGGKKGNDHDSSPGSDSRDIDDSRQHVGITGMVPDVRPQYVFLPRDPDDKVNNCHENAGSCTDPLYKIAMDHFCLGTCSKLGADGRDVASNCMPLADLCTLQSGPIAENLQKYCRAGEIDQVLVTLPNRVLDKIPTPPEWKKLPKSVRNKVKRIMRQRTKDLAQKHVELQQYIQSLPPKQKAVLAGPNGMGPASFL
ncbi:hypothetical protein Ddc_01496 [Ditylenchus destructor]|nr:hypothetical protein Ddc_01496 [Ditylenchus destructor]